MKALHVRLFPAVRIAGQYAAFGDEQANIFAYGQASMLCRGARIFLLDYQTRYDASAVGRPGRPAARLRLSRRHAGIDHPASMIASQS